MDSDIPDYAIDDYTEDVRYDTLREEIAEEIRGEHLNKMVYEIDRQNMIIGTIAKQEIDKARAALTATDQDLSGAYFHAYRAVDGYIDSVFAAPIAKYLTEPLSTYFKEGARAPYKLLKPDAVRGLRKAVLEDIAPTVNHASRLEVALEHFYAKTNTLRNRVVHGLHQPTVDDVHACIDEADQFFRAVDDVFSAEEHAKVLKAASGARPESDTPF